MACIIDVIKGVLGDKVSQENLTKLEDIKKRLVTERRLRVDGTALDPRKSLEDGFVYRGRVYKSLKKALDTVDAKRDMDEKAKLEDVKSMVLAMLQQSKDANTMFKGNAKQYLYIEGNEDASTARYVKALTYLKGREVAVRPIKEMLELSEKEYGKLSVFNMKNAKGESIKSIVDKNPSMSRAEYRKLWQEAIAINPKPYLDLKAKMQKEQLGVVSKYSKHGGLNPADILQNLVDNNWEPQVDNKQKEGIIKDDPSQRPTRGQTKSDIEKINCGE